MQLVLDNVHPGNLGVLPPGPAMIACKGVQLGLGEYSEFFCKVVDTNWYLRNRLY